MNKENKVVNFREEGCDDRQLGKGDYEVETSNYRINRS